MVVYINKTLAGINNIIKISVTALNARLIQKALLDWRVARKASNVSSGFTAKYSSQFSLIKIFSLILRFKVIGLFNLLRTSTASVLKFII